jgi:hypothetical protein
MISELLTVRPAWSTRTVHPVSFLIRYFSRPRANPFRHARVSHMMLIWSDRVTGKTEVHEALLGRGWSVQEYAKLATWAGKRGNHIYVGAPVVAEPLDVAHAYIRSRRWAGTEPGEKRIAYATKQIFAIAAARSVVGRWLGLMPVPDPRQVMCSEGACSILADLGVDLRIDKAVPFDAVTPEDALREWEARGYGITRTL